VIRSRDITFRDSIYEAKSVTNSSSLTKPIQKSQVVLVDIPKNLEENDSIVAEHGLSSKITQSPGGSSNTSEESENSRSFEESGRSDEEYSKDGASSNEGDFKTPQYEDPPEILGLHRKEGITKLVDVQSSMKSRIAARRSLLIWEAGHARSRYLNRKEGDAEGRASD
ncbi:hypothetical protein Tco_1489320, partial [Tanacetum coccineum]